MLFIGDLDNRDLSERLGEAFKTSVIYPDKHIFPDGEMRLRVLEEVVDQEIVFLKSHIKPVDSNILSTVFLIDLLKRNGAGLVTGVIPYLGYQRADHMFRTGEGVPLEMIISMLEAAGLAKIVIVDPHAIKTPDLFKIKVANLSALEVFAKKIKSMKLASNTFTLVTPDSGGVRRVMILSGMLGNAHYAVIEKNRDLETGNVETAKVEGKIQEICFVVDDMISSGGTIVKAVDALIARGAKKIYVMATHGIFSENAPRLLETSKAKKIFVTDSIPVPDSKKFKKLEILSIADLIAKSL